MPPNSRRSASSASSRSEALTLKTSSTSLPKKYTNPTQLFVECPCSNPSRQLTQLVHARVRRRFQRGLKRRAATLMTKLRKAKTEAPPNEKPAAVKTHLRDMVVVPEMIGSVIGIYNGKMFNTVEIKPEMTGHYLGEFSISYVPPPFLFALVLCLGC